MPSNGESSLNADIETLRIKSAFQLSLLGLTIAALLVVFLVLTSFKESTDIIAIVGLFTSILGTLVGAFFGLQIGSAGTAQANEQAAQATKQATLARQEVVEANQKTENAFKTIALAAGKLEPDVASKIFADSKFTQDS